MRPINLPILGLFILTLFGCQSSQTGGSGGNLSGTRAVLPVAVWSQFIQVDQQARPVHPPAPQLVKAALDRVNIHAVVDDNGVSVPPAEADLARQVLLTDPTLKDSGVTVIIGVPAGTGQQTDAGVVIPLPSALVPQMLP